MSKVAIFMGSMSDRDKMQPCVDVLESLGVEYFFTVTSAHRTPERTKELVEKLEKSGCQVYICAAGLAAHLAGAVAAKTLKPVLGVPLTASPLCGLDALLATVQMPPGFPVATLALDKVGARNAAWLAAQILALSDAGLTKKLADAREGFVKAVEEAGRELEAGN